MNERLTIQDLIDLLAAKHSMTKKDAEAFVKEFFLLIEQALENEKTVKINKRSYQSIVYSGHQSERYNK